MRLVRTSLIVPSKQCGGKNDTCSKTEECCGNHECIDGICGKRPPNEEEGKGLAPTDGGDPVVVNTDEGSHPVQREVRYLVFYKNKDGRDDLEKYARDGSLEIDIPLFNMAAAMLTPKAALSIFPL